MPRLAAMSSVRHAEDPLQDELLEDRRVQGPVGLRAARESLVEAGRVAQAQPECPLEVGVHVAEDSDAVGAARVELVGRAPPRRRRPPSGRCRAPPAWPGRRRGRRSGGGSGTRSGRGPRARPAPSARSRRPAGADLPLVGERGLVAVVAVGDQQLAGLELGGDRLVHGRVADPPDAVGGAVGVGDLAPRLTAERGLEVLPGVARDGGRRWGRGCGGSPG